MAVKKDLQIDQGATWCAVLCWKAGSPATPVDLTGCTARMHVRTQTNASDPPVRSLATGGQGITLGGVAGTITLELTAADTATLAAGRYVYDLEIVHADGVRVTRLCGGNVTVSAEVTR